MNAIIPAAEDQIRTCRETWCSSSSWCSDELLDAWSLYSFGSSWPSSSIFAVSSPWLFSTEINTTQLVGSQARFRLKYSVVRQPLKISGIFNVAMVSYTSKFLRIGSDSCCCARGEGNLRFYPFFPSLNFGRMSQDWT